MSLRLRAAIAAVFVICTFGALPAVAAGEFTDSAGRIVVLPAQINRAMPVDRAAEALILALARDKLAMPGAPRGRGSRYVRVPVMSPSAGPNVAATVTRLRPDVIIDAGPVTPARVAFADQTTHATGVPYILLDNSLDRTPTMLRVVGRLLGVAGRGDDLAGSAEHAINALRGRLLIQPATQRPRVYYARGPNGLETALPGSEAAASIEAAGAINVASALAPGASPAVTPQQLREWNPDIIIAEDRSFYATAMRNRAWSSLAALRNHKLFLVPSEPFGWIDDPAGINRLIGLYWLSEIFYPGESQDDLRSLMADFYDKFYGIKLTDAQIEAIAKTAGIPPSDTPHLAALPGLGTGPNTANPTAPSAGGLSTAPGVPGAVNEPGRRGLLPNETPPATTTPSYLMPK